MDASNNMFRCFQCGLLDYSYDFIRLHAQTCVESPVVDDNEAATEACGPTPKQDKGWSHEATLLLIETFREFQDGFSDPSKKKYQVWRSIALTLQTHGYDYDGAACDQKMRTLKKRYKTIKDKASLSGRGGVKQWPYYTLMDDLMVKDPCITPVAIATCLPYASTSTMQEIQSPVQVSKEPLMCDSPSPATSTISITSPTPSPLPSPLSSIDDQRPKRRRVAANSALRDDLNQHGKLLESIVVQSKERTSSVNKLLNYVAGDSGRPTKTEFQELKEIQQQHLQEIKKMQEAHREELKECRKEMQEQHREELKEYKKEMQEAHREEVERLRNEITDLKQELYKYHERFLQIQDKQSQQMSLLLGQREGR